MVSIDIFNEDIIKIFASLAAGSIIGAEREYKSKNAGFRTITLVTIGATLFTMLSKELTDNKDFHVLGNIVVGVGFLGAGAIFREGLNVSGLTTAATIWISAAIGMAIGGGQYAFALLALMAVLIILLGFSGLQSLIGNRNAEKYYKIAIKNQPTSFLLVQKFIEECSLNSKQVKLSKIDNNLHYTFIISGGQNKHQQLVLLLSASPEIISFEV